MSNHLELIFKEKESAKSFSHDLDDRNYTLGKKRDPKDAAAVNKIVEMLKSSKSSVEFTIKFLNHAFKEARMPKKQSKI